VVLFSWGQGGLAAVSHVGILFFFLLRVLLFPLPSSSSSTLSIRGRWGLRGGMDWDGMAGQVFGVGARVRTDKSWMVT